MYLTQDRNNGKFYKLTAQMIEQIDAGDEDMDWYFLGDYSIPFPAGTQVMDFYRFGGLPDGLKSYNYADNFFEGGVSVYKLDHAHDCNQSIVNHMMFAERPVYTGKGYLIGYGSDGEPVICPLVDTWGPRP